MWVFGVTAVVSTGNWKPQILVAGAYLAGALLLGAVVIALASRWRRQSSDYRVPPDAQLAHFRSLYEQGAISAEEFERLRNAVLGTGSRPTTNVKPAPTGIQAPNAGQTPPVNGSPPDNVPPA